ncbi:MAG: hypothetical protein KIS81_07100 [Maricaulaceae bacterium]|nr:hypothetical protein [Maricaulaceae bacterium]
MILIGVAAALAALVALDHWRRAAEPSTEVATATAEPAAARPADEGPLLPAFDRFSAIDQRPLFSAARRPPERPAPVAPVITAQARETGAPAFQVTGVVSGPGRPSAALIRQGADNRRLYAGETFEGWRIESVETDGVVVSRDGERWRLPVGRRE